MHLSGLIAGIIGGIVVTIFSGSKFGVSGPAAGLITIVVAGIATLDGENDASIFSWLFSFWCYPVSSRSVQTWRNWLFRAHICN